MKVLVVTAMYPTPDRPAFGSFIRTQVESLKQAGVDVELLVLEGRPRKLMYLKGIVQLHKRLAKNAIDLIHAHYSYAGILARTQWRVPVVVSYCGDDLLGTVDARGKQTPFSRLVVAAGRVLSQCVDAVIVKNREMASKLKRKDVYIIPHEVDFQVFSPVDRDRARSILGLDPGKKYLLFAADPQIPVKRFPLAKTITECVSQQDTSVELIVAFKEVQSRLALYMSACDALLFTSFQEGSPNVVKQAMACNLPIVATDVGDVREVIGNTKGCYVCYPSVTELAGRVNEVLRLRERTQGRLQVRHLECSAVARNVVQVYEETLEKYGFPKANRRPRRPSLSQGVLK